MILYKNTEQGRTLRDTVQQPNFFYPSLFIQIHFPIDADTDARPNPQEVVMANGKVCLQ